MLELTQRDVVLENIMLDAVVDAVAPGVGVVIIALALVGVVVVHPLHVLSHWPPTM